MNIFKYIIPVAVLNKLYKKPANKNYKTLTDSQKDALEDARSDAD